MGAKVAAGEQVVEAPKRAKRRRGSALEQWQVSIVKAMLAKLDRTDQDILAYFTRPTRSVNHRLIGQIRKETAHKDTPMATDEDLAEFLATWPDVDTQTGLSLRGDELLIKARETMIAAVHTFNGAGLHFRAELFIVTAIIAWTHLHHACFRRLGIDHRFYRNVDGVKQVVTLESGAERYWELGFCLKHEKCPVTRGMKDNLEFLIELRHEIEHRSTSRIDDAVSTQLQVCCINFNDVIEAQFGAQFGLKRRLPIALQFMTFSYGQARAGSVVPWLPACVALRFEARIRIANRHLTPPLRREGCRFRQPVAFLTHPSGQLSRHFRRGVLGVWLALRRVGTGVTPDRHATQRVRRLFEGGRTAGSGGR